MSVPLTIAGTTYQFPTVGENNWGQVVTQWATAVSTQLLQRTGGAFSLTNDVNFGANFATIQAYLKSRTADISNAGFIRMAVADAIAWRNNANNGNLLLIPNASNQLTFNGDRILTAAGALTASKAVVTNADGDFITALASAVEVGYLVGVTSAIQTQLDAKQATITFPLSAAQGGNGVANNAAATTTRVGNFGLTWTLSGITALTLPTSGTLATLAGSETLSNKTLTAPFVNGVKNSLIVPGVANYVVAATDTTIAATSATTTAVTLPAATGNAGQIFRVIKTDTGFTAITVTDGTFSTTINTQNEAITVQSNGTTYLVLDRRIPNVVASYTPTFTGFGTAANVECVWSRMGAFIKVDARFTCGTPTATEARLSLPSGLTSAGSPGIIGIRFVGAYATDLSTDPMGTVLMEQSVSYMTFGLQTNPGFPGLTKQLGNALFQSGEVISYSAMIPIAGWNG